MLRLPDAFDPSPSYLCPSSAHKITEQARSCMVVDARKQHRNVEINKVAKFNSGAGEILHDK